ncbi:uncharacterized protein [Chelonus insularis]|uniref:uncharacterized protein n=1 Tax=Chelonus insularis TaxID=460826 RepID=UPI00158877EB|nr:uncharacterized protein LOC118068880 [Chelonus insularis]
MQPGVESNQLHNYLSTNNIQVFAIHEELIERVSQEISTTWKLIPIFLHFLSAVSGYATSILFYIFWNDIFGGQCPIWAKLQIPERHQIPKTDKIAEFDNDRDIIHDNDWRKNVIITFLYEWHCNYYHFICLCSCSFGVIWCMLFARCATGIYAAQWLIVPPALIFETVFTAIVYSAAYDFEHGYLSFTNNLKHVAYSSMNATQLSEFSHDCDLVVFYLKIIHFSWHNLCQVHYILKILSWTMAWSWIGGLAYLLVRIIVVNDFRLLRTIVYKISNKKITETEADRNYIIDTKLKAQMLPPKPRIKQPTLYLMAQT